MSAYVAAQLQIHDPTRYDIYARRFASTLDPFDGELLIADADAEVLVGDWRFDKFVLVRFASKQTATAWSNSADYQRIAHDRQAATSTTALLLQGLR